MLWKPSWSIMETGPGTVLLLHRLALPVGSSSAVLSPSLVPSMVAACLLCFECL